MPNYHHNDGFTLIELLIVIGIIGILASVVIVAINPSSQLTNARDAKRLVYAKELRNAAFNYIVDAGGYPGDKSIPTGSGNKLHICQEGVTDGSCINWDDLAGEFIKEIPVDDLQTGSTISGYSTYLGPGARIVVVSNFLGQ